MSELNRERWAVDFPYVYNASTGDTVAELHDSEDQERRCRFVAAAPEIIELLIHLHEHMSIAIRDHLPGKVAIGLLAEDMERMENLIRAVNSTSPEAKEK